MLKLFSTAILTAILALSLHAASEAAAWAPTGSLVHARASHSAVQLLDGRVLVVGGSGIAGSLTFCEVYDPATGAWTLTGSTSFYHTSAPVVRLTDGRVLVIGGGDPTSYAKCERYDPATGLWSPIADLPDRRMMRDAVVLADGRVLVATGYDIESRSSLSTCYIYDPLTNAWAATGSMASTRHTEEPVLALLADGTVLVAGTSSVVDGSGHVLASCERFINGVWVPTGEMPLNRTYHRTFRAPSGHVLAFGGHNSTTTSTCALFDPQSGTWATAANMSVRRYRVATAATGDGRLVVAGGLELISNDGLASCELYDPAPGTWRDLPALPAPRAYAAATTLPSGNVMLIGGVVGPPPTWVADASVTILMFAPRFIDGPARILARLQVPFTHTVAFSNHPTVFQADGLPPGLVLDAASGTISGTPTTSGDYLVEVVAANAGGKASTSFTIAVEAIQTSAPTFAPAAGSYASTQNVILSSATAQAIIHYTLDGSEPTLSSAVYTGPLTVAQTATIKALARAPHATVSPSAAATYTITSGSDGAGGVPAIETPASGGGRGCGVGSSLALLAMLLALPALLGLPRGSLGIDRDRP